MKSLSPQFKFDENSFNEKFAKVAASIKAPNISSQDILDRLDDKGWKVERLNPTAAGGKNLLCADSSFGCKHFRFTSLWAGHCVTVFTRYDGKTHKDPLTGSELTGYADIGYESFSDFGNITACSDADVASSLKRIKLEYESLVKSKKNLETSGEDVDLLLVDGSLSTVKKFLDSYLDDDAFDAQKNLLTGNVASMVEDSRTVDISLTLGFDYTNTLIFDIALKPLEYVVDFTEDISTCYVKLPSKPVDFTPEGVGPPITVRWEFNYPNFKKDLEYLASMWYLESDIVHPQIYPLRLADYLTRKVKISSLLESLGREHNLKPQFRSLREL